MATIFPEPPLVAYRRPQSLRDKLVKSKVPEVPARPKREVKGIKKCLNVNCVTCPYVSPGREIKCTATGENFHINSPVSCDTENIIYCITCKRCQQQYVGQSGNQLSSRIAQHRGYINNYNKHKEAGKATQPSFLQIYGSATGAGNLVHSKISNSLPRHQQKSLALTPCQVDIFYFCLYSNLSSI